MGMVEKSRSEMKELQVELMTLKQKYNEAKAEIARKDGLIFKMPPMEEIEETALDKTFDKMQKSKQVRDQMKEFINDSLAGADETPEEREKRRANLRAVKRIMQMRNGYSAKDSHSKRKWLQLRRYMKDISELMGEQKGKALFDVIRKKSVYVKQTIPQMRWSQIKDNMTILTTKMRIARGAEDDDEAQNNEKKNRKRVKNQKNLKKVF